MTATSPQAEFERSFRYDSLSLNGVYKRTTEWRILLSNADAMKTLLDGPDLMPRSVHIENPDTLYDSGRWKVSFEIRRNCDSFGIFIKPERAPWEKYMIPRRTKFTFQLATPVTYKLIKKAPLTTTFDGFQPLGLTKVATISEIRQNNEIKEKRQLFVRILLTETVNSVDSYFVKTPSLDPNRLLDVFSAARRVPDIHFCFPDGTLIRSHRKILEKRCPYFATLFESGLEESSRSQPASTEDTPVVAQSCRLQWDTSSGDQDFMREIESCTSTNSDDNHQVHAVSICDFSPRTYEAFLCYLETGCIEFDSPQTSTPCCAPVDAQFTVKAASPKSIYRLADKYDMPKLVQLAQQHILATLVPGTVLREFSDPFSSMFPEFLSSFQAYAIREWRKVLDSPRFGQDFETLYSDEVTRKLLLEILKAVGGVLTPP